MGFCINANQITKTLYMARNMDGFFMAFYKIHISLQSINQR